MPHSLAPPQTLFILEVPTLCALCPTSRPFLTHSESSSTFVEVSCQAGLRKEAKAALTVSSQCQETTGRLCEFLGLLVQIAPNLVSENHLIYSLTVLEARIQNQFHWPEIKAPAGPALLAEDPREQPLLPSYSFGCQGPLACGCISLLLTSGVTLPAVILSAREISSCFFHKTLWLQSGFPKKAQNNLTYYRSLIYISDPPF